MMKPFYLDHIAVLVKSLEAARSKLARLESPMGPIESFPGEGTLETYVGPAGASSRLLLVEAADANGPYGRALTRRGPGLHHIAINVGDLSSYIESLSGSGWLLLPQSLKSIQQSQTAWLCRPGVGTLIEVHERTYIELIPFVTDLEIPIGDAKPDLLLRLAPGGHEMTGLRQAKGAEPVLTIRGKRLNVRDLA